MHGLVVDELNEVDEFRVENELDDILSERLLLGNHLGGDDELDEMNQLGGVLAAKEFLGLQFLHHHQEFHQNHHMSSLDHVLSVAFDGTELEEDLHTALNHVSQSLQVSLLELEYVH
jgi:hypothetical protein